MQHPIYFDHAATTPMHAEVLEAYTAALATVGNPSSIHAHGQAARAAIEDARERVARALGADPTEVVFTSGGTEGINLALKGLFAVRQREQERPIVIVADGEHHATVEAVQWLESRGAELRWIPLTDEGEVTPAAMRATLAGVDAVRVALVTVMLANNEVGTINPVAGLAAIAAEFGIPLHIDAVAALGQVEIDFAALGAATLSISAHKIGGPVGSGALLLSRSWELEPLHHGGAQQRSRSGTLDVAAAIALAVALERATRLMPIHNQRMQQLRDRLIQGILTRDLGATLRGARPDRNRLSGNAHFTFAGCQGDSLLYLLDMQGISVSTGSACHAGVAEVSHVLLAMGLDEATALGALRVTLGEENTEEQIDALLEALPDAVERARQAGLQASLT